MTANNHFQSHTQSTDFIIETLVSYFEKGSHFYNSLDTLDISIFILVTLTAFYFYTVYLHVPDADPAQLAMQAVHFPVRNPGESNVFRSLSRPPGTNLLSGLPVRDGGPTKFRNCTMKDIWEQIPKSFKFYRSLSISNEEIAVETFDSDTIKPWASIVGNRLVDTLNEVSSTEKTVLVIVANNSIESLVTIFAAVLFNIPVRIIQQDPLLRTSYLESMLRAANPFAILVSDEDIMKDVLFEKYTPNLKLILYTGNALQGILPKSIKVTKWDEFMITGDNNPQAHWAKTFPAPDTESPLLGTVFMNKASGVPVERLTPSISTFSNNQIMTAILSQRAFIPKEAQWNPQDKLLVFTAACNMYTLIYQLAALVEGVSLSYIAGQDVSFYETIQILRPTILVCDDFTSWLILSYSKGLGIFSDISFAMNMSSLSRGTLKRSAAIDFLNSVRFIYTYQNIYPYLQVKMESGEGKEMNQVHCNALRALTGAAVFHGLISPLVAGPICQTTIADYRTDDGPTSLGRYEDGQDVVASTTFINLGPPMPSIEYKVSDFPGSQLADQFNLGMLQVRGTTTCTSSGTWVDTGIMAHIGSDGCVKILFRKVDHPNQEGKKKVVEKQYELMKLHELKIQESEDKHRVVKEGVDSQTEKQYPEQRAGFI